MADLMARLRKFLAKPRREPVSTASEHAWATRVLDDHQRRLEAIDARLAAERHTK
jgi:hypothetical protein